MCDSRQTLVAACFLVAVASCGGGSPTAVQGPSAGPTGGLTPPNGATAGLPPVSAATPPPTQSENPAGDDNDSPTPASPDVAPYDPDALPALGNSPTDPETWPSWRRSMQRWEWRQIPGSDLASVAPNPAVPGALNARVDAWNGLAADMKTSRLYSAANGGHADYSGNEVYEIDLGSESPKWTILKAPTSTEHIVKSDYSRGIYNDYYLDGRPASTHTYYALNFISSRNAIFKFGAGSLWGTGNEGNWNTDAFSLTTNDWHSANTWPNAADGKRAGVIAASICKDPVTEHVYLATPDGIRRFDPSKGSFTTLAMWIQNASAVYARGCAVDTDRHQVVYFGDTYRQPNGGLIYDIAENRLSQISFTGTGAAEITKASYNFAWYEPRIGSFLLKTRTSGIVYAIDPLTWMVEEVATIGAEDLPDAANGVHTRWQRLPLLGGYAYYPRHGSGVWFLAIE